MRNEHIDAPVIAEGIPDHDDEFEEPLEDDGRGNRHEQRQAELQRLTVVLVDQYIGYVYAFFHRQQ